VRAYVDTPFGQLHYASVGEGPVLLLLHQTPRSHDEFRELQPLLADGRRVIAMDMLGFGMSAPLPAPQRIEQFAAGAFALLDALGIAEAVVLGHHTGAVVALEMAASAPDRVRALIMSSTPWTGPEYRERHATHTAVDNVPRADDGSHLTELWQIRQPYYPAGRPDLLERFIRDALAVDPAEGHRACGRYVMEDRVGLVTAPVLLLGASADPFGMRDLPMLSERLANAEAQVVEGGTVPLMEQAPKEVVSFVTDFLGRLPSLELQQKHP
jgi:pimeloyl-ACP methyl ester carboxylesterase